MLLLLLPNHQKYAGMMSKRKKKKRAKEFKRFLFKLGITNDRLTSYVSIPKRV